MLFNSYIFLFAFLPVAVIGYYRIGAAFGRSAALGWLTVASLFFYGWWNPVYLVLIGVSILANYGFGLALDRPAGEANPRPAKAAFALGAAFNLALIGYFKYFNFFAGSAAALTGRDATARDIVLPLGISFFTFQQVAYLADVRRGRRCERSLVRYALFVTFFPQLIAGPILHPDDTLPQFTREGAGRFSWDNLSVGLSIFIMGLFKKVMLADGIAAFSTPIYSAASLGVAPTFLEAWAGAFSYAFQIYFDFSGYSDMAIGGSRMFGILLPLNFRSPYQAESPVEFWRRWHMTLSRFLRDYLYVPLGGNRKGKARRHLNLAATMLLGGLWHGAGWTFVIWGGLHGLYLIVNRLWRDLLERSGAGGAAFFKGPAARSLGRAGTFLAVCGAWVFFRADDLPSALLMAKGLVGMHGVSLPVGFEPALGFLKGPVRFDGVFNQIALPKGEGVMLAWLAALTALVWFGRDTVDFMRERRPALNFQRGTSASRGAVWSPSPGWAALLGLAASASVLALSGVSEFIYFQF